MTGSSNAAGGAALMLALFASALALGLAFTAAPVRLAQAQEMESSIARGGQLYDKWYKVIGAETPTETHPAWPASNTKKTGDATQRCKACHGWDLKGKDGAYASGSYQTGIKGLTDLAGGSNDAVIAAITNELHGFAGKMDDRDLVDLANFVTMGQFDIDAMINPETKAASGDAGKGEAYYNTVCANCHGLDGKLPKEMDPLGPLSNGNPWEVVQKIRNGQPGEKMPALRALDLAVTADILSYLQTLPE